LRISTASAQATPVVHLAEVTGVINPLTADYVKRTVQEAEAAGSNALILRMDTPGGLDTAMRDIVQAILSSKVPVVVYVAPAGARAASAGLFIAMSAHVVAMAPGTNIGAAHPVSLGGGTDEVAAEKALADAAAYMRSLAETRSRNQEWAERAVRESVSASATEAVDLNIADLIATDLPDLLQKIDGRQVTTASGQVTLRTAGATVAGVPMNFAERFLHVITEPNIALALISIGMIGILAEFYHPGLWYPGILGVISLVLAWMALGSLPTNWAGVLLLVLAFALLLAEIQSPGVGAFAAGAVLAFVLGSLLLFRPVGAPSPTAPDVHVNPAAVLVVGGGVGILILGALRAVARARFEPVAFGPETLIGSVGIANERLAPHGTVHAGGEDWSAVSAGPAIAAGRAVRVLRMDGLVLVVEPTDETPVLPSAEPPRGRARTPRSAPHA
jgi:membrane-bound serine protease (ClpP class)